MKHILSRTVFAVVALVLSVNVLASYEEAKEQVDTSIKEMIAVVDKYHSPSAPSEDNLITDIATIVDRDVDFTYISSWVMGKYYRQATPEQQAKFAVVFKQTLIKTYAKSLVSFDIKEYAIAPLTSPSPEDDKQIVTVDVTSGDSTVYTLVNYMVKTDQHWKLVNVIMNGINFRITFKNQFADLMQRNGYDVGKVVDSWQSQINPPATKG
jgi:phospholipid transport system substrate-binding protein